MIAAAAAAISESLAPVDPEKVYDEYLYDHASQYGEDSIKIVRIQKTAEPLVIEVCLLSSKPSVVSQSILC